MLLLHQCVFFEGNSGKKCAITKSNEDISVVTMKYLNITRRIILTVTVVSSREHLSVCSHPRLSAVLRKEDMGATVFSNLQFNVEKLAAYKQSAVRLVTVK